MLQRLTYASRATLGYFVRAWTTQAKFAEPPPKTWAQAESAYDDARRRGDTKSQHRAAEDMRAATTFALFRQRRNGEFPKGAYQQ